MGHNALNRFHRKLRNWRNAPCPFPTGPRRCPSPGLRADGMRRMRSLRNTFRSSLDDIPVAANINCQQHSSMPFFVCKSRIACAGAVCQQNCPQIVARRLEKQRKYAETILIGRRTTECGTGTVDDRSIYLALGWLGDHFIRRETPSERRAKRKKKKINVEKCH